MENTTNPVPVTVKTSRKRGFGKLKFNRSRWLTALIIVLAVGAAVFFYTKYHTAQNKLNNPTAAAQQLTKELVAQVGQLTVLPTGEQPTVATVSDVSKLSGQVFFANAQNGDKVLIYTQAKKAYLFRPSLDKIINIAPVNLGSSTP